MILTKEILPTWGPFIEFADIPQPITIPENEWPSAKKYGYTVFFELADGLVELYCGLTKTYAPFDIYEAIQLSQSQEINTLASAFLSWAIEIAQHPLDQFTDELNLYIKPAISSRSNIKTEVELKGALIETLLFIVDRMNKIAAANRTLLIIGI